MNKKISTRAIQDFLLGYFKEESTMLKAVRRLREEGFAIHDVYTPYAVHALDQAMGVRRSRLALVTFFAGLTGLVSSLFFQFWTNVFDWNVNIGGKPDNSTLAFIPVSFEITILFGALVTVLAFFIRSRLYPGKVNARNLCSEDITNDLFMVALERSNASFDLKKAKNIIYESGAQQIVEASV